MACIVITHAWLQLTLPYPRKANLSLMRMKAGGEKRMRRCAVIMHYMLVLLGGQTKWKKKWNGSVRSMELILLKLSWHTEMFLCCKTLSCTVCLISANNWEQLHKCMLRMGTSLLRWELNQSYSDFACNLLLICG